MLHHRRVGAGDVAGFGQNQPDGELGHGSGVAAGRVDNADPAGLGGLTVDVLRAAPQDADDLQVRGRIDELRADRGELGDHDVGMLRQRGQVVVERYGVRPVLLDEQVDFLEPLDRVGGVPGHDVDAVTGLAQGARALLEHVRGNVGIRDG